MALAKMRNIQGADVAEPPPPALSLIEQARQALQQANDELGQAQNALDQAVTELQQKRLQRPGNAVTPEQVEDIIERQAAHDAAIAREDGTFCHIYGTKRSLVDRRNRGPMRAGDSGIGIVRDLPGENFSMLG